MKDFSSKCLCVNPGDRAAARELLHHQWIHESSNTKEEDESAMWYTRVQNQNKTNDLGFLKECFHWLCVGGEELLKEYAHSIKPDILS